MRLGFSLLELMIVLAVATMLTGLMLPALGKLRENVNRVMCSSNLRQIGIANSMFTHDHNDLLPRSVQLTDPVNGPWRPQELMAVHNAGQPNGWDGLGLLFSMGYCSAAECFYCPSHRGDHPMQRYIDQWDSPGDEPIYANYHYAGHRHWDGDTRVRTMTRPDRMIIASDGLRTVSDFNHVNGMNAVYGDASVRWIETGLAIIPLLPDGEIHNPYDAEQYNSIWKTLHGADAP
jgi:prepilin-type N-terminal cleavage/methylation domain-containing protein